MSRPRMRNPSHKYSPSQWRAHQSAFKKTPDEKKALIFIKKFGLSPLLTYSFPELLRSVKGRKPGCFAKGDWNILPGCQRCKEKDSTSKTEGFFDMWGRGIGKDAYGIFSCCNILSWVRHLQI